MKKNIKKKSYTSQEPDWNKILSKTNSSIEELSYEEQHILEQYEQHQKEYCLYLHEFPNNSLPKF